MSNTDEVVQIGIDSIPCSRSRSRYALSCSSDILQELRQWCACSVFQVSASAAGQGERREDKNDE